MGTNASTTSRQRECLSEDVEGVRGRVGGRLCHFQRQATVSRTSQLNLQATVSRLEESVKNLSHYKNKYIQMKRENSSLRSSVQSVRESEVALTQARAENERLIAERQRCEKCLDQVAQEVVQALLALKGLREEVVGLRERVKELESENKHLNSLLEPSSSAEPQQPTIQRPVNREEVKSRWSDSFLWLLLDRPRSLNLETASLTCLPFKLGVDGQKDEGYSTMSSEAAQPENSVPAVAQTSRLQEQPDNLLSRAGQQPWRLIRSLSDSQLGPGNQASDWWDMDLVQAHWLRLEETRSLLQNHIYIGPIELEEWTMDDITLAGSEEVAVAEVCNYGETESPRVWSSCGSGSSTVSDVADPPATNFTSDFYQLVKFDSTKSLASSTSDDPLLTTLLGSLEVLNLNQGLDPLIIETFELPNSKTSSLRSVVAVCEGEKEKTHCATSHLSLLPNADVSPTLLPTKEIPQVEKQSGLVENSLTKMSIPLISCSPTVTVPPYENALPEIASACEAASLMPEKSSEAISVSNLSLDLLTLDLREGTSKQLIDQLNKLAEDDLSMDEAHSSQDEFPCCPTSWVRLRGHLDPMERETFLEDLNRASSSYSSDSSEDHFDYEHLHRIHRSRRHKKASAQRDGMGALRRNPQQRLSVIGRSSLFSRFGAKEEEAIASFDFLEELSTPSPTDSNMCQH